MALDFSETEHDLLVASSEVSTLLQWSDELFQMLCKTVEATGRKVDDLTVGELRQYINERYNTFNDQPSVYVLAGEEPNELDFDLGGNNG